MDVGWYQGSVKVVPCDGQRSADLYKKATSKLGEICEGANIVALDWCDVGFGSQQQSRRRRTSSTCCKNATGTSQGREGHPHHSIGF